MPQPMLTYNLLHRRRYIISPNSPSFKLKSSLIGLPLHSTASRQHLQVSFRFTSTALHFSSLTKPNHFHQTFSFCLANELGSFLWEPQTYETSSEMSEGMLWSSWVLFPFWTAVSQKVQKVVLLPRQWIALRSGDRHTLSLFLSFSLSVSLCSISGTINEPVDWCLEEELITQSTGTFSK